MEDDAQVDEVLEHLWEVAEVLDPCDSVAWLVTKLRYHVGDHQYDPCPKYGHLPVAPPRLQYARTQ